MVTGNVDPDQTPQKGSTSLALTTGISTKHSNNNQSTDSTGGSTVSELRLRKWS